MNERERGIRGIGGFMLTEFFMYRYCKGKKEQERIENRARGGEAMIEMEGAV